VPDLPMADRHETVLPPVPTEVQDALAGALASEPSVRKAAVAAVAAAHPAVVDVWAELSALSEDPVERYAYARVGYHRGLDALRANGWGGRGLVRWSQPSNRGVLTCLAHLRDAAASIGEDEEVTRLAAFLEDLDPGGEWPR
jgi:hypothetical protein